MKLLLRGKTTNFVLKTFIFWRVLLFGSLLFLPILSVNDLTYISRESVWANFDGIHYLSIARGGYVNQAAFFPLFPILIRLFSFLTFGNFPLAGLLVANLSLLIGLYYLYRLVRKDYGQKVATWSLIFLVSFPTSFFLGSLYSESLFLLTVVLSFFFSREKKWFVAALFGAMASFARPIGFLVLPALFWEAYSFYKKDIKVLFKKARAIFLIPLGTLSYSYFNYLKWGDALYFIKAHGKLANSRSVDKIILFPQTIYRYFKILFSLSPYEYVWWISFLELAVFFLISYLLIIAYQKRIRMSYLIFAFLAFFVPISSGTFSGLPRYSLPLFPIFIALAFLKNDRFKKILVFFFFSVQILLLLLFSRGFFVA